MKWWTLDNSIRSVSDSSEKAQFYLHEQTLLSCIISVMWHYVWNIVLTCRCVLLCVYVNNRV